MNADDVRTCTGKFFNVVFGIGHHQVAIKDQLAMWAHTLYHSSTKANVRYKMTIHNIDMGVVCSSCFKAFQFTFKIEGANFIVFIVVSYFGIFFETFL